jgi:hypothetical protein
MAPKSKKLKTAKQITQVKKAIPKPKATKKAAPSIRKPTAGGKPKSTGDQTRPGPLGQKNGSGSIPYQGPGPMGQGGY